jgi:hypothetical protein
MLLAPALAQTAGHPMLLLLLLLLLPQGLHQKAHHVWPGVLYLQLHMQHWHVHGLCHCLQGWTPVLLPEHHQPQHHCRLQKHLQPVSLQPLPQTQHRLHGLWP